MNDSPSSAHRDSRDPLSSTLRSWRHEPAPAPDFNASVWSRIHAAETAGATSPAVSLFNLFRLPFAAPFPLAAGLAILLSLAAGTGGAFALNRTVTAERMAAAYVRSIDPVQMTVLEGPHHDHVHPAHSHP